jgi:hypothetical protein
MPCATFIPTIVYVDLPLEAHGGQKQAPTAYIFEFPGLPGNDLLPDLCLRASSNPSKSSVKVLGCLRNKFELLTIHEK